MKHAARESGLPNSVVQHCCQEHRCQGLEPNSSASRALLSLIIKYIGYRLESSSTRSYSISGTYDKLHGYMLSINSVLTTLHI